MKKYFKYFIFILIVVTIILGLKTPKDKKIEINIKDYGKIVFKLDSNNAPITVDNFIKLVNSKFYNGLTIHRVVENFMIQGGDPSGDGTGGSMNNIKGEFSSNGVNNNISHKRGVISMARSKDNNSASSQFFIMQKDNTSLDGKYAAFGYVASGIEVVDKIVSDLASKTGENGLLEKKLQPVIEYIKVIE